MRRNQLRSGLRRRDASVVACVVACVVVACVVVACVVVACVVAQVFFWEIVTLSFGI